MKFRPIRQTEPAGCGPACAQMIFEYFGIECSTRSERVLRRRARSEGLSNEDLCRILRTEGLNVKAVADANWGDLRKKNGKHQAIVVSWMLKGYIGHFSLVDKATLTSIRLTDPETGGITSLPRLVFLRLWFDYDDLWYPRVTSDIQLRWMCIVTAGASYPRDRPPDRERP